MLLFKQIFTFFLFLLLFFVAIAILNFALKKQGVNMMEKKEVKRLKIKEYRGKR